MLMDRENSVLAVIDIQERLLPHMHDAQGVLASAMWLVRLAGRLAVPTMASEQYPRGLGRTHGELLALLQPATVVDKLHFSCAAAKCFEGLTGASRRQVVVCGIEAHVCVLQTVLELRAAGRDVFVVADAVSSRRAQDRELALARMRAHGAEIVSREMVAFEWLKQAGTDEFRAVSSEFLR